MTSVLGAPSPYPKRVVTYSDLERICHEKFGDTPWLQEATEKLWWLCNPFSDDDEKRVLNVVPFIVWWVEISNKYKKGAGP